MIDQWEPALLIPSIACGAAFGVLALWVFLALRYEEMAQGNDWRYDVTRINELRKHDVVYRMGSGVIRVLARLNRAALGDRLNQTARHIRAAGLSRFWLPEEYLARMQILATLMLPLYLVIFVNFMGPAGTVSALLATGLSAWLLRRRLARQADQRLWAIKRRMPYFLDLLTLLMEAGSSFLQALAQAIHEFAEHGVATEFGRVLADMNMGKSRREAFDNMRDRLKDDEIGNIIGAMIQSEELGTPLSQILRSHAEVLRIKRSQRAETVAAEAGVKMLLPGILVMAATMLVILGPFMLNYFLFSLEM